MFILNFHNLYISTSNKSFPQKHLLRDTFDSYSLIKYQLGRKLDSKILKHLFTLEHLLVDHQTIWKRNRNLKDCDIAYLIIIKIQKFSEADVKHCHLLHNQHLWVLYFLVVNPQPPLNHTLIMVQHRTVNSLNSYSKQPLGYKDHNNRGDCDHFEQDKILAYLVYLLCK